MIQQKINYKLKESMVYRRMLQWHIEGWSTMFILIDLSKFCIEKVCTLFCRYLLPLGNSEIIQIVLSDA